MTWKLARNNVQGLETTEREMVASATIRNGYPVYVDSDSKLKELASATAVIAGIACQVDTVNSATGGKMFQYYKNGSANEFITQIIPASVTTNSAGASGGTTIKASALAASAAAFVGSYFYSVTLNEINKCTSASSSTFTFAKPWSAQIASSAVLYYIRHKVGASTVATASDYLTLHPNTTGGKVTILEISKKLAEWKNAKVSVRVTLNES